MGPARMHHYQFAHKALLGCCAGNPPGFFRTIASDEREGMIRFLWDRVCQNCDPHESTDIRIEDLDVVCARIGSYPTLVFEMPKAEQPTEALFVVIVLLIDVSEVGTRDEAPFRYFTLELGFPIPDAPSVVLCEWSGDEHSHLGESPEPTIEALLEAIEPLL